MRHLILWLCSIWLTQLSYSQSAADPYKMADSLYKAKDYKNAAAAYNVVISAQNHNAAISRYRAAAGSWAMANIPDSAFHLLNIIVTSDKLSKIDLRQIEYGIDYAALRTDKRWNPVLDNIRKQAEKNAYPQEEFIYGRKDGMALTLVQIRSKIKSNGKAIISVRSGNWASGYNGIEIQPNGIDQYLSKGYTVFAVMHGSQPRYAIPDEITDLKRAVRYIRYNAAKFGIDPDHIGITGNSSGGHLSLMVATADDKINASAPDPVDRVSSRVQAVAILFPPTDLLNWGGPGLSMVNAKQLLKPYKVWGAFNFKTWNEAFSLYDEVTDTSERNKIAKEISPIYAVSADDPPVLILHGDADVTVPIQQSQSIIARFKEAGVIHSFIIKKGGKHNPDDMNPDWQQFVDWFDKYLK